MVSTPLKNISQNGNLPQIGVKIKKIETTTYLWCIDSVNAAILFWINSPQKPSTAKFSKIHQHWLSLLLSIPKALFIRASCWILEKPGLLWQIYRICACTGLCVCEVTQKQAHECKQTLLEHAIINNHRIQSIKWNDEYWILLIVQYHLVFLVMYQYDIE